MKHRTAILTTLALAFLITSPVVEAQQTEKPARIGILLTGTPETHGKYVSWLRDGMRQRGYVEGQSFVLEPRFARKIRARWRQLAEDLVRQKVDVIVAIGIGPAREAAKASRTIPIVLGTASDLVGSGLVASLARPGGNITGMTSLAQELGGKRLELLKEALPRMSRVAVLYRPEGTSLTGARRTQAAGKVLGIDVQMLPVNKPADFDGAFKEMKKGRADALVLILSGTTSVHRKRLTGLAAKSLIPVMCPAPAWAKTGCFMSYGAARSDLIRRSAGFVDRILKGAKPADLPVEQPTKFDLVLNMKTAKALGITIPPSILLRATEVIE